MSELKEKDPTLGVDRKERLERPKMYGVVLVNDDFTPMEFVVELLERVFRKSHEDAERITFEVHKSGRALAGVYTFEVAETKCAQVIIASSDAGHPLQVTLEQVD